MPRIGTLLGLAGRPEAQVQIMRQGAKNTRVRQQVSIGHRAVWDTEDTIVPSQWVLDDGGALWDKHRENPKGATWLSVHGQPQGRLLIHQVYKTVVKAKLHLGDDTWSHVEGFQPDAVLFDGGLRWGLRPPLGADQGDAEQHACDTVSSPGFCRGCSESGIVLFPSGGGLLHRFLNVRLVHERTLSSTNGVENY
ncbi:hypothetical protein [Corynebacterium sputi]|uniref:hypothetical protein n=1 Tax=Corynebacterium sputi TaxID=489915 RepID=UPI000479BC11|nr:hypothetical protein [Corynebacterium sputi]